MGISVEVNHSHLLWLRSARCLLGLCCLTCLRGLAALDIASMCVCLSLCLLQTLIEQQQSQLKQYEWAAGQCVSQLQQVRLQGQSLQAKIQESETTNQVWRPWPERGALTVLFGGIDLLRDVK